MSPIAKIDGSKPEAKLPRGFGPGGGVVEGYIEMTRANVRWRVLGHDSSRVWARSGEVTAWLGPAATT